MKNFKFVCISLVFCLALGLPKLLQAMSAKETSLASTVTPMSTCLFPAGPLPSAAAPVAVAVDPVNSRIYVVHRKFYRDIAVNTDILPTDRVSVVDQKTGNIITTVEVGKSINGLDQGIAVDTTRNRVYVANEDDNTVSVIDSTTNAIVATTTVGNSPLGIAVDPDKGLVYVANGIGGRSVTVLNATTGAVHGTISLSGPARSVTVDPSSHLAYVTVSAAPWTVVAVNGEAMTIESQVELSLLFSIKGIAVEPGSRLYVSDFNTGMLVVFDISGNAPSEVNRFVGGQSSEAVAVDPSTNLVYVVGDGKVNIFNSSGDKLKTIEVLRLPSAIAIDPTFHRAYVTNTGSDSLSVLDTDSQALASNIILGTVNVGMALDSTTKRLYAANFVADSISVVDTSSRTMVASWLSGPSPWAVAVDPGVQQLYSLNTDDGTLSILSTVDGQIKGKVELGKVSAGVVAVNPSTHRVYVTDGSISNTLTVLDGTTNKVVATIPVGNRPVGIAIDEAFGRVYVANQQSGTINVIDIKTNQIIDTWKPKLETVWSLALDSGLRRLYVTITPSVIGDFSGLQVLDADTGTFIAQIPTGNRAALVAANQRTHQVFVTDSADGTVSIIDGTTNTLVMTVSVGNTPHGLSLDEESGVVYVGNALDGTVSCNVGTTPIISLPDICCNMVGGVSVNGGSFSSEVSVGQTDTVDIDAGINSSVTGMGDIYLVLYWEGIYFFKIGDPDQWVPWGGISVIPYQGDIFLSGYSLDIYSGSLGGLTGDLLFFVAYWKQGEAEPAISDPLVIHMK